ncbi:hypothetical protein 8F11_80 [uncultured Caudovirales phage]|uniref:N-acetylmuramoyl-L-alanine amidase n=1 Tax=uncultured Caudovirales phage TaxID=2100421 RepID=A0A2H4IZS3_9CAUD|nr:hypothetical protein 8F11_80 [uncultured Caudovirales phage]
MSYVYKQNLLASSKYPIKSPYSMTPQYITVHNTANDASAENEIRYMLSNGNQVSYHVAIDDKESIQAIPFNRNAWHCGDGQGKGNRQSIGIEICYSKSGGPRYVAAEENAVQYIAQLLKQYGWGIDRVKKHQDWNGKYCPHRILSENRWNSFLKRVEQAMKPNQPTIECAIDEGAKVFRVQSGAYKTQADAERAAQKALDAGAISYATIRGTSE